MCVCVCVCVWVLHLYSLARNQSYDDGLAEILRRYGDHLYNKGDYQGAIEQYKNAIRHLEPSYVIRKVGGEGEGLARQTGSIL